MGNLKTNRSVGLYVGLTILMNFLPIILLVVVAKRFLSESAGLVAAVMGFGGGSLQDMLTDIMIFLIMAWVFCIAYAIYVIVLFWGICRDMNRICGKYNLGNSLNYIFVWLLSSITLNIFNIFWSYQQGKRLKEAERHYQRQVKGSGASHLVFALLGSAPTWVTGFVVYKLRTDPLYFMGHTVFILVIAVAGFLLGFMDMVNRAYFIKDVNILAEAYNGQPDGYGTGGQQPGGASQQSAMGSSMQISGASQGAAMGNPVQPDGADAYTMPVDAWMPDAEHAWKPEDIKPQAGYMEGCRGEYQGAMIPVEGEIVIGRDETNCHVVIKKPDISRKHCTVRYNPKDGTYTVVDCSSNGVYNRAGNAFPKNVPVACGPGTVLVIAKSGNEFLLK